jgi:hypothetical protein
MFSVDSVQGLLQGWVGMGMGCVAQPRRLQSRLGPYGIGLSGFCRAGHGLHWLLAANSARQVKSVAPCCRCTHNLHWLLVLVLLLLLSADLHHA